MAEETKKTATTSAGAVTIKPAANPASSQRLALAAKVVAARTQDAQAAAKPVDAELYIDSSDPIADVRQPETEVVETQAGAEILPVDPGAPSTDGQADPVAATYGVHSGKIGNSVPIVDDYTPTNPRSGGIIGGAGGPGAVGRVKAEQDREKAAKQLMAALVDGADATRRQADFEAQVATEGKTKYRVVGGSIFTDAGKVVPGQPAYLSDAEAKRFSEMGRIAPWFD